MAAAFHNRGNAYRAKGDLERAIADYSKLTELEPTNAGRWRRLAVARCDNGDFNGAARDLLRSIELKDDVYAMLFRYVARRRTLLRGNKAEAEAALKVANRHLPDDLHSA